jgi:hypothetical protein
VEGLESRQLLSWIFPGSTASQQAARAAIVRHEANVFASELQSLELKSQATPQQFLALRDDARAISLTASATTIPAAVATGRALPVTLQLDRSPLYGSLQDLGWNVVSTRVTTTLASLGVSQSLTNQTIADMKSIAASAGVTASDFDTFTDDFNTLRNGLAYLNRNSLYNTRHYHIEDPAFFYAEHLRGFFRGWAEQKNAAEASLQADLQSTLATIGADRTVQAAVRRDVSILERLGATVTSTANAQLDQAYLAAFARGLPVSQDLDQLRSSILTLLGPAGVGDRLRLANQLVSDAPIIARAAGASLSSFTTLVNATGIVVNAGGDETLDPFKIVIYPHSPSQAPG